MIITKYHDVQFFCCFNQNQCTRLRSERYKGLPELHDATIASPIANKGTEFIDVASEGSVSSSVYIPLSETSASVEFVDPISATIFITDESCILILP